MASLCDIENAFSAFVRNYRWFVFLNLAFQQKGDTMIQLQCLKRRRKDEGVKGNEGLKP